jgi:hypothetical protein
MVWGSATPRTGATHAPKRIYRPKALTAYGFILETRLISHCTTQAQIQNRENNPMHSRMGPGSHHVLAASGAREQRSSVVTAPPNLIPH